MDRQDQFSAEEVKYLKLLSKRFPTIQTVSSEIINLRAILDLPKGTEHFMSDLHGEHEAFLHILGKRWTLCSETACSTTSAPALPP